MGKNLQTQRRGRGTQRYSAPSFNYVAQASHRKLDNELATAVVKDIVHCPGHYAPLIELKYSNGEEGYDIAPEGIRTGDVIQSGINAPIQMGNTVALKNIPEGTEIFNVEGTPGDGGKFIRTSGCVGKVMSKTGNIVKVLMPSRKEKEFDFGCRAQIGVVAGTGRPDKPFMKAGDKWFARKTRNKMYPRVCGVSKNAVDHPFGGKSSHHKGKPTVAPRNAPAGRKVGKIRPRRTGMIR